MSDRQSYFYLLILASLVGIAIATLSPFKFTIPSTISLQSIHQEFQHATNLKDYIRNILLFIPLGIGYGGSKKHRSGVVAIVFTSLLLGAAVSFGIELTQILLIERISSISDIICNGIGSSVGASLYSLRRELAGFLAAIINKKYSQINSLLLLTIICGYCEVLVIANLLIVNHSNLSNWNENYHLAIGSEVEGSASWNGYLTNLYISDRSLDQLEVQLAFAQTHRFFSSLPSLITAFVLMQKQTSYRDYNQQIADLIWQSDPQFKISDGISLKNDLKPDFPPEKILLFNHRYSLLTKTVPKAIAQRIKSSNQFTISLTCATKSFDQVGPARIVTYAGSLSKRNLIIAQEGKNLILFLRTPITGASGSQPHFVIPNVFKDDDFHQLIITFKNNHLTFYIDDPIHQYNFEFNLATAGKLYLPWKNLNWRIDLTQMNLTSANLKFYGAVCLPLASLVGILMTKLLGAQDFK